MSRRAVWLALAVLAFAWFGTLELRPLYRADESRYAEIPREMVASGDWVTPRLNGFKYFEKPPLQYWTTAALFDLFGERDWVARFWTALTGFAGILLALAAGNRLFGPPAGNFAALVLAGSPLYVLLGQVNTLDMGLTFFLSAAVFAFAAGYALVFWAACALAVLSKGLIGIVLPLATIGLYTLIKRDWGLVGKMKPVAGVVLFCVIAAPWFIAVALANDEFLHFFFIQEHFQRFTTRIHGRYQPPWYFLPILAVGIAPWLLPMFFSAKDIFRRKAESRFDPALFLGLWALVVFVFFSASGSKLPSYILPMFPPLAVLIGSSLAAGVPRWLLITQAGLVAAAGIAAAALAPSLGSSYPAYVPWMVCAALCAALGGLGAFALAWRDAVPKAALALAAGGLACTQLALAGHRTLAPNYSAASLVTATAPIPAAARIYAVKVYDHSLPWYLRRTVTMVGVKDELAQAIEWERDKFVPDLPAFARAWKAESDAYAVVSVREYDRLRGELPMEFVARDPRYVLVRKP